MSLYRKALVEDQFINSGNEDVITVWDWVRSQIDFKKFRERAIYARNNPCYPVKVVIMEYSSEWRNGDSVTQFFVPNTEINTKCLLTDSRFLNFLHQQISNSNPTIEVYTRRKIVYGMPHDYRRQLVVKFNSYKEEEPPSPILTVSDSI